MSGADPRGTNRLTGPAIGLLVTSLLCLFVLLLGMAFSIFLLASGEAERLSSPPSVAKVMTKRTQIEIRMAWNATMMLVNTTILAGAIQMLRGRGPGLAHAACVLALIPCVGPCFVLGMPFGIWGLVVLRDPAVKLGPPTDDGMSDRETAFPS